MSEQRIVSVDPARLPLQCPPPGEPLWNQHPRVFLTPDAHGEACCPYCGTLYRVEGNPAGHAH